MINTEHYIYSKFPESLFPSQDPVENASRLLKGLRVTSNKSVVIAGLCRNIRNRVHQSIARLNKTASLFGECSFVIYENDSDDGTSEILKDYALKDSRIHLIQESMGWDQFERTRDYNRAKYLSDLRNNYLNYIDDNLSPDYVIVIDLDIEGGWSYDGILNCFSYTGWSVMSSNGISFREKKLTFKDQTEIEYERILFDTWAFRSMDNEDVIPDGSVNHLQFNRGEKPQKVFSNFGGLAIYNWKEMRDYRYGATRHDDGSVTCDHPFIHKQIRNNGGSIFLNPSMITLYSPTEFSEEFCFE